MACALMTVTEIFVAAVRRAADGSEDGIASQIENLSQSLQSYGTQL